VILLLDRRRQPDRLPILSSTQGKAKQAQAGKRRQSRSRAEQAFIGGNGSAPACPLRLHSLRLQQASGLLVSKPDTTLLEGERRHRDVPRRQENLAATNLEPDDAAAALLPWPERDQSVAEVTFDQPQNLLLTLLALIPLLKSLAPVTASCHHADERSRQQHSQDKKANPTAATAQYLREVAH
jgi:hypothetical protein